MDVERSVFPVAVEAPDLVHQRAAREDDATVFHQQAENLKLLVGQLHVLAVHTDDVLRRADIEHADLDAAGVAGRLCAAQHGPHPRQKLHHAEGLGDEVVRAAVKTDYAVIFRIFGCQDNDGKLPGRRGCAQLPQNAQTVLLGQHDVQKKKLRELRVHSTPEFRGQREALRFVALTLQAVDDQLADAVVVLEQIDHKMRLTFKGRDAAAIAAENSLSEKARKSNV